MPTVPPPVLRQHLIDPQVCIRCNTCEETCPVRAITHDSNNYVVNAEICNGCGACIPPCPTGSIDNWRIVDKSSPYTLDEQLGWEALPEAKPVDLLPELARGFTPPDLATARSAAIPPRSAARPEVNLYSPSAPATATVTGNYRVTAADHDSDTHHLVLDFGSLPFPVLEGQSIGVIPPGQDLNGRPHHARQYSVASARDGERSGYNNVALLVKRVTNEATGRPFKGVASNYLCDLGRGDQVKVIGPFGGTFLMPDDPESHLLMICTGTGAAPMRAMTQRRRRTTSESNARRLTLFFGARTPQELPYHGPLGTLPASLIETHLAFSRLPGMPRRYVQDLMIEKAAELGELLRSRQTYVYVCGLRSMEDGVLEALGSICAQSDIDWSALYLQMKQEGRIHLETY